MDIYGATKRLGKCQLLATDSEVIYPLTRHQYFLFSQTLNIIGDVKARGSFSYSFPDGPRTLCQQEITWGKLGVHLLFSRL